MRTINQLKTFAALLAVIAISVALPSSAFANATHKGTHETRVRHQHHRRQHHRRHHKHHSSRVSTSQPTSAPAAVVAAASASPATYTPATITATTYYVSPTGSDSNSGTSPAQAWQTIHQVNKASVNFKPGDGVLFQGGATYTGSTLEPGWGAPVSGTASNPIVFGTYGQGLAAIPAGVWFSGNSNLVFQGLDLGPAQGISGTSDNITVQGCSIHDMAPGNVPSGGNEVAINAIGSQWIIRGNRINDTGDSGMLIRGDHFQISGNVITNTGLDAGIGYPTHGIYLKASDSSVTGNTILHFHMNGVSVRYRNSVVSGNTIGYGQMGIGWFQYDTVAGTSQWTNNRIIGTTIAAIYVSPSDIGGSTRESFHISDNQINRPAGNSIWKPLSLEPTSGTYSVAGNQVS